MVHIPIRRWITVLGIALLLASCTRPPAHPAEPAPARPGAEPAGAGFVTIRITHNPKFPDPALDAVFAAFQEQHPEYRVEKVPIDPLADDNSFAQMVLKGEVDLFSAGGNLGTYSRPAANLRPFAQKTNFDLYPFNSVVAELSYRGELLELPWAARPKLLVANWELLQQAGVKPPANGWTWDEFLTAARKTASGTGDDKVWGLANYQMTDLAHIYVAQAVQAGRSDEEAVGDVLGIWANLIAGGTMPPFPKPDADGHLVIPDIFAPGRAGFTLLTPEGIFGSSPPPFDWRVLPMPVLPGAKSFTPVHLAKYAMSANSPNQDAAWELLSFMAGPEGALAVSRMGAMPYRLSPETKQAYLAAHPQLTPDVAVALSTDWITFPDYLDLQSRMGLLNAAITHVLRGEDGEAEFAKYKAGVLKLPKQH